MRLGSVPDRVLGSLEVGRSNQARAPADRILVSIAPELRRAAAADVLGVVPTTVATARATANAAAPATLLPCAISAPWPSIQPRCWAETSNDVAIGLRGDRC